MLKRNQMNYNSLNEQIRENFYVFKVYFEIKKNYSGGEIPKDVEKMLVELEKECQHNVKKILQIFKVE